MIKIGAEYLEYDKMPEVVKQVKTPDTIDSAGDFSYSFTVPTTPVNVRLLKINLNQTGSNLNKKIPCSIERFGTPIHIGYLAVDGATRKGISITFYSGNTEWFTSITDPIYLLDMSAHKLPLANIVPSPVVINSWTATEGIIYPLVDTGLLEKSIAKVVNVFHPFVYVKTVMHYIFQQNGFKLDGEMLSDSVYNKLVAGVDNQFDPSNDYLSLRDAHIGKNGTQVVNTTASLITFSDESYPYYDRGNNFESNRYTADVDMSMLVTLNLVLDTPDTYIITLRRNGSIISTYTSSGDSISFTFNSGTVVTIDEDQYFEVWMETGSGPVTITSGSVSFRMVRFDATYPQFIFGNMMQSDFVKGIFRMLNVIATYDPFTKTVTCNLFKNVTEVETDLSQYVSDFEIDNNSFNQEIGRRNRFLFKEGEEERLIEYNKGNELPYAAGDITSDSELVGEDTEYELPFTSSFSYYNETFKTWLADLGITYLEDTGDPITITGVTNSGGDALFTTAADHGLEQLDFIEITDTSTGEYVGVGRVASIPTSTTFELQDVDFLTAGATGTAIKQNRSSNATGNVFIGIVIPDLAVSDFMIDETEIKYSSSTNSNIAYFYFIKDNLNLPVDNFRELPVFGSNVQGSVTLLDKYYGEQKKYFNKPVKVKASMHIPFNVFNNLDQTKSVRIKTDLFNMKGFAIKNEGFNGPDIECFFEFINLE